VEAELRRRLTSYYWTRRLLRPAAARLAVRDFRHLGWRIRDAFCNEMNAEDARRWFMDLVLRQEEEFDLLGPPLDRRRGVPSVEPEPYLEQLRDMADEVGQRLDQTETHTTSSRPSTITCSSTLGSLATKRTIMTRGTLI
jgi:hypothetical protein